MKAKRPQGASEGTQVARVPWGELPEAWMLAIRMNVGGPGADGCYGAMPDVRSRHFKRARSGLEKSVRLATIVDIQSTPEGNDAATKSCPAVEKAG